VRGLRTFSGGVIAPPLAVDRATFVPGATAACTGGTSDIGALREIT
jgi:hypothetical protein